MKGQIICIQVIDPRETQEYLLDTYEVIVGAKGDEILVNSRDKKVIREWMLNEGGWDADTIVCCYPELL